MDAIELGKQTIRIGTETANVLSDRSPLAGLVSRPAVSIGPDATLGAAVEAMEAAGVSALLVDRLGGIITERDIARALGRGVAIDAVVESVATPHPVIVPGTATVVEACGMMLNEQVRHLVVDHEGTLGVVSLRDVAAVLLQSSDSHIWLTTLRIAIESPPETPPETWLG